MSPALVTITLLVVVPMSLILIYSFYINIDLGVDQPAFSFENWSELFTDNYYHVAIWKTFRLSVIVTVLAALLGYIPAYFIANTTYKHKWLLLLLLILLLLLLLLLLVFLYLNVLLRRLGGLALRRWYNSDLAL